MFRPFEPRTQRVCERSKRPARLLRSQTRCVRGSDGILGRNAMRRPMLCCAILVLCATTNAAGSDLPDGDLESLHPLILPGKDDSQWMNVAWLPATNIWAARQKAA